MATYLTINALPESETLHALFVGYRDGQYAFSITGQEILVIPENLVERGDPGRFTKGEDLHIKRNMNVLIVRKPEDN